MTGGNTPTFGSVFARSLAWIRERAASMVLTSFGCYVLVLLYRQTFLAVDALAYAYLSLGYLLCAVSLLAWLADIRHGPGHVRNRRIRSQVMDWIGRHRLAISAVAGACALLVIDGNSQRRLLYNLSTTLAYAVLLLNAAALASRMLQRLAGGYELRVARIYILFGLLLAIVYWLSTTMDPSDPLGPHFQLRLVVLALLVYLVCHWLFQQWRLIMELRGEQTKAELMQLRNQVGPHFLFNSLNNIYGLAREKSDATPDLILRLSELMRHTIHQSSRERVTLAAEVEYLRNYMALQQVRLHHRGEISFEIGAIDNDCEIAPLLLIMLLENAFKHGVEQLPDSARLRVELQVHDKQLSFTVENNVGSAQIEGGPGIGLSNLKRRLQLIYPGRHTLRRVFDGSTHVAQLEISL